MTSTDTQRRADGGSNLKNPAFWNVRGLFFFYVAIWQLAFTFLSRWLEVEAGMSHGNIGLLNSVMALTAHADAASGSGSGRADEPART